MQKIRNFFNLNLRRALRETPVIEITQDFTTWPFIGQGAERVCYQNPQDPGRCVKVSRKKKARETWRDIESLAYLRRRAVPFTHMPQFFGIVETEELVGMEMELIRNADGSRSLSLAQFLQRLACLPRKQAQLQQTALQKALRELKAHLVDYNINFCDYTSHSPRNWLVVEEGRHDQGRGNKRLKVVIVDGLGEKTLFLLGRHLRYFGKMNIKRRFGYIVDGFVNPFFSEVFSAASPVSEEGAAAIMARCLESGERYIKEQRKSWWKAFLPGSKARGGKRAEETPAQ